MDPSSIYSKWWLPLNASTVGKDVDSLILITHVFMAVLFVGWGIFFVYCLVRFRQRPNQKAAYAEVTGLYSKSVELAVILVEAFLLFGISWKVWGSVKNEFPTEEKAPVHVRIFAKQFEWFFQYPGKDGKFGRIDPAKIDSESGNTLGHDPTDPDGKDDIVKNNIFVLPIDKPIIAELASRDVIHSFKVPVLRFTQDVIPGLRIPIWFEAIQTGNFDIACAQLCGNGHTKMRAEARIVTQQQFEEWLKTEKTEGQKR